MTLFTCPDCGRKIFTSKDEMRRIGTKRIKDHINEHVKEKEDGTTRSGQHVRTIEEDQGRTSNGNEPELGSTHVVPDSV